MDYLPRVIAIVAVDRNRAIGKDGDLGRPRIPADMARFSEVTSGHPVIMMRKTWDSIPEKRRPLPDRTNIVVSRKAAPEGLPEGVVWVNNPVRALQAAALAEGGDTIYVIGGSEGYATFMPATTHIDLTTFDHEIADGDAFFPEIPGEWDRETVTTYTDEKSGIPVQVEVLTRTGNWRPPICVEPSVARSEEYKAQLRAINSLSACPFCYPDGFTWNDADQKELAQGTWNHWGLFRNHTPLPNTEHHYLIVSKSHVATLYDLPPEAAAELSTVTQWIDVHHNLDAGVLTLRHGINPKRVGQSVHHLHAQYIVPEHGKMVQMWFGPPQQS